MNPRFRHICGQARKRAFRSPHREAARQGVRPLCFSCPHKGEAVLLVAILSIQIILYTVKHISIQPHFVAIVDDEIDLSLE